MKIELTNLILALFLISLIVFSLSLVVMNSDAEKYCVSLGYDGGEIPAESLFRERYVVLCEKTTTVAIDKETGRTLYKIQE